MIDYNGPARPVDQPLPTRTAIEGSALASCPVEFTATINMAACAAELGRRVLVVDLDQQ